MKMYKLVGLLLLTVLISSCSSLGLAKESSPKVKQNWRLVDIYTMDIVQSVKTSAPQTITGKKLVDVGCKGRLTPDSLKNQVMEEFAKVEGVTLDNLEVLSRIDWIYELEASGWKGRAISTQENTSYTFRTRSYYNKLLAGITLADPDNHRHYISFWVEWGCTRTPEILIDRIIEV